MRFYWFVIATLGVWRITHLLSGEDGPWNLVVALRRKAANGFWAKLLDCFYCLSLWIAAPFALSIGNGAKERFCLWLASSAGAIMIERITSDEAPLPAYIEDGVEHDGMLRKSESSGSADDVESKS